MYTLTSRLFRKILIANRGEIALRVIRACKKLGIKTVAVYSDVDIESLHVRVADEAYRIGPSPPQESYLDQDRILSVASECKAEAIHPGYGFLAENPGFIRACEDRDFTFIGPSRTNAELLGSKLEARRTMASAGIPVIPASEDAVQSEDDVATAGRDLGFPVLIKAVYGGGGRGLRIARNVSEARRFYKVTETEARSAFARPEIYVEKYVEKPRHVEIQVLADKHGSIIHLGERECSIQRRHQKLIEEAPSPAVNKTIRKRLVSSAIRGLRAASYQNAGTVEFLLDSNQRHYFLEVNKRLQVEHLVTEMTTGVDIAEQQIRIAAGERLAFRQEDIHVNGWAINCRINAEDPTKGFSPTPGRVVSYIPPSGPGIRVDSALYSGYTIPEYYDSLIAKVAAWGSNRSDAISRLTGALDEIAIEGIPTTIPVHKAILRNRAFRRGEVDTHFIQDHLRLSAQDFPVSGDEAAALSAAIASALGIVQLAPAPASRGAVSGQPRWVVNARLDATQHTRIGGSRHIETI
jgi:acetyl-CoA carboxylase biotin carboxylase subunit